MINYLIATNGSNNNPISNILTFCENLNEKLKLSSDQQDETGLSKLKLSSDQQDETGLSS